MLSKCANPGCSASFLYLHQGKLFRLETSGNGNDAGIGDADPQGKPRLQFFDFATRKSTTVSPLDRQAGTLGLAARPDGRTILFTRNDSSVVDLMLVENFR